MKKTTMHANKLNDLPPETQTRLIYMILQLSSYNISDVDRRKVKDACEDFKRHFEMSGVITVEYKEDKNKKEDENQTKLF